MRRIIVAGLLAATALAVACSKLEVALKEDDETELRQAGAGGTDIDLAYALPGSPQGIATNGRELMIANRREPWGAIRLRRTRGGGFTSESLPIIEPRYEQKMQVNTLTWNGTHYAGITTASWFGRQTGDVFTIHDPKTMRVVRHVPAPPLLGCLAWDGTGYWAATRRNTRDAAEPVHLYRLDRDFGVIRKTESPAVGCQGLAWDGAHLWYADVFDDAIYILDVTGEKPRVVHRQFMNLEYLSGLVFFEDEIWLVDYGDDRLRRIRPASRIAWGGTTSSARPVLAAAIPAARPPQTSDTYKNPFFDRDPADAEIIEWSAELRDGSIVASWSFWFGSDLFARNAQSSSVITIEELARYEITVTAPDGSETKKTFDAVSGENTMRDVVLGKAIAPGEYRIGVFIHVQYVTADGQARILNNSGTSLELRR